MVTLGVRFLNGWYMAAALDGHERAEWPPHPDRVFMALAAAHYEADEDAAERRALEWLESLGAPTLHASAAHYRTAATSFVPVNDMDVSRRGAAAPETLSKAREAGLAVLPEYRARQARHFPVAIPEEDCVYFTWPADEADAAGHLPALRSLCGKVSRIGHSASLVQMWVADESPTATLVATPNRTSHRLRVPGPGRLADLEAQFAAGQRPTVALWSGYAAPTTSSPQPSIARSVFDERLLVLRRVDDENGQPPGRALGIESTLQITEALRGALMSRCPVQPPPEWLCGHKPDGAPSNQPHLAFLALPFVGHEHADGHLLGVALAVPREPWVTAEEETRCLTGLVFDEYRLPLTGERALELTLGGLGLWRLSLEDRPQPPATLRPATWTADPSGAVRWASVTPIVFDRHPKGPDAWQQAEEAIATACEYIRLPRPTAVSLSPVSPFAGVGHVRTTPHLRRKSDNGSLHHTHATLTFAEPVVGPVLLGAGRYRGYGLCRPLREAGAP